MPMGLNGVLKKNKKTLNESEIAMFNINNISLLFSNSIWYVRFVKIKYICFLFSKLHKYAVDLNIIENVWERNWKTESTIIEQWSRWQTQIKSKQHWLNDWRQAQGSLVIIVFVFQKKNRHKSFDKLMNNDAK